MNKDLGFTNADRVEDICRITVVSKLIVDAGIMVLTAFMSPFRAEQEMAYSIFEEGEFIAIFVDTLFIICEQRDVKGLYKKANEDEIPNFTGIGSPYKEPKHPKIIIKTEEAVFSDMLPELMKRL